MQLIPDSDFILSALFYYLFISHWKEILGKYIVEECLRCGKSKYTKHGQCIYMCPECWQEWTSIF